MATIPDQAVMLAAEPFVINCYQMLSMRFMTEPAAPI